MATSQSSADTKTVGMITEKDAGGFVYTLIGAIRFYTCTGVPNHSTGVKGSLCVRTDTGKLYIDSDGAGAWKIVTSA
tara:strand:- start:40 stop:270 length:231 start_codon:yes stop_codon:yes gene_type:complete